MSVKNVTASLVYYKNIIRTKELVIVFNYLVGDYMTVFYSFLFFFFFHFFCPNWWVSHPGHFHVCLSTSSWTKLNFSISFFFSGCTLGLSPLGAFYQDVGLPSQTTMSITDSPGTNWEFHPNLVTCFLWRSTHCLTSNKKSVAMYWDEYYVS